MLPRSLAQMSLAVSVLAVGLAVLAAWRQDSTYDEPFHLSWSQRLLETGETERESAERYNSKTPAALPNVLARKAATAIGVSEPRALRFAARLPSVLWLGLVLVTTFALARSMAGTSAGALATIGVALDPNLIAHGSLVTVDVVYALATLLALGGGIGFAREPSLRRGALLGLALGFAFAVKFTAVLLVAGLFALPLAIPPASRPRWRDAKTLAASAIVAGLLAILIVDLAYLGRRVGLPLREANLTSPPLARLSALAPELPMPLPASFLRGIDRSLRSERGWGPVVLLGQSYPDGVFYYFAALWALKTPILLALAQLIGLVLAVKSGALREPVPRYLFANLVLTLCYFSFLFKTQIGYRFVLMCVPIAWVLAAPALSALKSRRARILGALALAVAIGENLIYVGNPLAFTNSLVWPKRDAYRLVADSNIDWGQNRDKISGWLRERGIPASRLDPLHLLPGPNIFSVNGLAGVFYFDQHRWLRANAEPVEHWGHTYLRYQIENETFDRFIDAERRILPNEIAQELCPESLPWDLKPPGAQVPFERTEPPEPGRVWVACVKTERGIDLAFRLAEGRIRFGRFSRDGRCESDLVLIQDDQVVWSRLEPGTHAFCAVEIPNRRPTLPYAIQGLFVVRGRPASLHVRPLATGPSGAVGR